jgi:23S rRNA A1618 N6-methylase RlmF
MKYDVVLCNPPYYRRWKPVIKDHLKEHLKLIKSPGYYVEIVPESVSSEINTRNEQFELIASESTTQYSNLPLEYYIWKT